MKYLKYVVISLVIYSCSDNKSEKTGAENPASEAPASVIAPPVKAEKPVSDTLATQLKDLYDYENLDSVIIPDLKKLHLKYASAPFHALLDGKRYFIVSSEAWNFRFKHFDGSTLYGIVNEMLEPVLPLSYQKIFNPDMTLSSCFEIKADGKIGLFNYRTGLVLEPQFDYIYPSLNGDTETAFGLKNGLWFQIESDLSTSPAPDFDSLEQLRKLSFDISRVDRSKMMINSYSEYYPLEKEGDGKGVLVPPSYINQLNLSGLSYYNRIILPEQGYVNGTKRMTITKSDERSITDKIRSFFVSFYEEGVYARGYHNESSQLVVHNEKNEAVNTAHLVTTDEYDYFCKEADYQFVNDSIVETRYNDTGSFYRFETRYKYHKVGLDGSITALVSNRYFNFTKFILIEDRHLKGCFAREMENPMDDYNYWKYDHLSIEELDIMRNEIFADYGYKFKTEKWQKYFEKRSWYKPLYDDVNALLSDIDKANVKTILRVKESMKGREKMVVNKQKLSTLLQVKRVYFLLASLVGLLILVKSLDYLNPDFTRGFLLDKDEIFPFYRFALYAHIIGTPLALFSGIYQFLFIRSRVHQSIGKIYISSILLLAAPSGLFMSFYAIGGFISTVNFLLMSVFWFGFTLLAYSHIKAGNVAKHRQFMTRSFILTNSAILIRLFSFVNNHYSLADVTLGYIVIAWLSWLPGLVIYECCLLLSKRATGFTGE